MDGSVARNASISSPWGLAYDPSSSRLYFTEATGNRVRYVNMYLGTIHNLVGTGATTLSPTGIPASEANITAPRGIDIDPANNLVYVVESGHFLIRCINLTSGIMTSFAGKLSKVFLHF
jgi:DNA-binding beta-propeller fold protein YncE